MSEFKLWLIIIIILISNNIFMLIKKCLATDVVVGIPCEIKERSDKEIR